MDNFQENVIRQLRELNNRLSRLVANNRTPNQALDTTSSPSLVQLTLTGSLVQTNNLVRGYEAALANLGTLNLGNIRGLILLSVVEQNVCQLVIMKQGVALASVADQGLGASLGADAGATLAVVYSGADWIVKNRYGAPKTVRVQVFGNL